MDRLTEWRDGHGALTHGDGYTKLARYEDLGLEPEEMRSILDQIQALTVYAVRIRAYLKSVETQKEGL